MKILKFILIAIIGIVALLMIVALFTAKDYSAIREVTINKPKSEVFEYVKLLKNQDNYSVWANRDPEMKKDFRGTDGTVGFTSLWDSKNPDVGKGEQEILKIIDEERIEYEIRFIEPFASTSLAYLAVEGISETQTKVKWGFTGKMKYPTNLFLLTMDMEGMIGKDFQDGLNKLKMVLEK